MSLVYILRHCQNSSVSFYLYIFLVLLIIIILAMMKRMMINLTIHSMKVCLLHDPWTHQNTSLRRSTPAVQLSHLALRSSIMAPATAWWRCRKSQTWTCPRVRCTTTTLPVLSLSRYSVAVVCLHTHALVWVCLSYMCICACMHVYVCACVRMYVHAYVFILSLIIICTPTGHDWWSASAKIWRFLVQWWAICIVASTKPYLH